MRVFVTGASGNIGRALTKELLSNGHQVLGLARNDASAEVIRGLGAEVQRGTIRDLDVLAKAAGECDAVAHLAFDHDFANYVACCAVDRAALEAMGSALAASGAAAGGADRALVMSSGTSVLPHGALTNEDMAHDTAGFGAIRGPSETVALAFVDQGVRVSVMRLPSVYAEGALGFVALLLAGVRAKGVAAYLDAGENRWPAAHTLDVARLYRLALEKGGRGGSRYHAVAEEGVRTRDIAELLGERLNVPVVSKTWEEAPEIFGPLAAAVKMDNPSSSTKTREELGWNPTHPKLMEYLQSDAGLAVIRKEGLPKWAENKDA